MSDERDALIRYITQCCASLSDHALSSVHNHVYHCLPVLHSLCGQCRIAQVLHCRPSHNIQLIFITINSIAGNVKSITCVNLNVIFLLQSANITQHYIYTDSSQSAVPLVLWHCRLGVRKSIWPVKKVMRCWCGYLSGATCRLFAYGPLSSQKPIMSCLINIQNVLTSWYCITSDRETAVSWARPQPCLWRSWSWMLWPWPCGSSPCFSLGWCCKTTLHTQQHLTISFNYNCSWPWHLQPC